jgi:hypothetical protein
MTVIKIIEKPIGIEGVLRVRELPVDWDEETFRYWWGNQLDEDGKIIGPPRMSLKEKDRYTVYEQKNSIMTAGITALLTLAGVNSLSGQFPWGQYFSVGTGGITGITPSDNSVAGENFRKISTLSTITGNQNDISTFFAQSEGNTTYTNAGLYGGSGASSTNGTGTLYAHVLYPYTKSSANPITNDYVIQLVGS